MLVPSQRACCSGCDSVPFPHPGAAWSISGCLRLELPRVPWASDLQPVHVSGPRGMGRGPVRAEVGVGGLPRPPEAAAVMTS